MDEAATTVRLAASERRACAIGEIGLDYHYDFSPRDVQQDVFRAQIELALELQLPVIIHTREATDDTFAILRDAGGGRLRGVFHCFTGDEAMARARSTSGSTLVRRHRDVPGAEAMRERREIGPPTGSSSKPTRPIWRRFRTGASATNRRTWPRSSDACAAIRDVPAPIWPPS